MKRLKAWLAKQRKYIGTVRLYRWRGAGYVLVPGDWEARLDKDGRIYMVIAPYQN